MYFFVDGSQTDGSSHNKKKKQKSSKKNKTDENNKKKRVSFDDTLAESIDNPGNTQVSTPNPYPQDIYGQVLLNAIYGGSIYSTRPASIYGNRSVGNILPPENMYVANNLLPGPSIGNLPPPENIYGNPHVGNIALPYGNTSVGSIIPPVNINGVMQEDIYGSNVNTLSVHNYPGCVTSENLYGRHN